MHKAALLCFLLVIVRVSPVVAEERETADPETFFTHASQDELVVFAIPSYYRLNWSNPRSLLFSVGKSYTKPYKGDFSRRPIGHVFILLKSSSTDKVILTGMAPSDGNENKKLFLKYGYGLGVLGADNLGEFENAGELAYEGNTRLAEGTMAYIRFLLTPETSKRLVDFYRAYDEQDQELHYGGANRPLYGEGAGCSAFGAGFIETAGLMTTEYENNWKININIPTKFFGGPLTNNKVKVKTFIGQNLFKSRWAHADEDHIAFSIWDPTLINRWIHEVYERETVKPSGTYTPETTGKARGLVFDATQAPTPSGPLFLDPADCPNTYGRQGGLYHSCKD